MGVKHRQSSDSDDGEDDRNLSLFVQVAAAEDDTSSGDEIVIAGDDDGDSFVVVADQSEVKEHVDDDTIVDNTDCNGISSSTSAFIVDTPSSSPTALSSSSPNAMEEVKTRETPPMQTAVLAFVQPEAPTATIWTPTTLDPPPTAPTAPSSPRTEQAQEFASLQRRLLPAPQQRPCVVRMLFRTFLFVTITCAVYTILVGSESDADSSRSTTSDAAAPSEIDPSSYPNCEVSEHYQETSAQVVARDENDRQACTNDVERDAPIDQSHSLLVTGVDNSSKVDLAGIANSTYQLQATEEATETDIQNDIVETLEVFEIDVGDEVDDTIDDSDEINIDDEVDIVFAANEKSNPATAVDDEVDIADAEVHQMDIKGRNPSEKSIPTTAVDDEVDIADAEVHQVDIKGRNPSEKSNPTTAVDDEVDIADAEVHQVDIKGRNPSEKSNPTKRRVEDKRVQEEVVDIPVTLTGRNPVEKHQNNKRKVVYNGEGTDSGDVTAVPVVPPVWYDVHHEMYGQTATSSTATNDASGRSHATATATASANCASSTSHVSTHQSRGQPPSVSASAQTRLHKRQLRRQQKQQRRELRKQQQQQRCELRKQRQQDRRQLRTQRRRERQERKIQKQIHHQAQHRIHDQANRAIRQAQEAYQKASRKVQRASDKARAVAAAAADTMATPTISLAMDIMDNAVKSAHELTRVAEDMIEASLDIL